MAVIVVAPPGGMVAADPIRMIGPPPAGVVPLVNFVVVAEPRTGVHRLSRSGRGNRQRGRQRHQRDECDLDFAHLYASTGF